MKQGTLIIPVHDRREVTLACLRHLGANGDLEVFEVVVVDDGSSDGTGDAVRAEFPGVTVLRGDGDLWWTGAMALGMAHAAKAGAGVIGWLNDDCLPAPGTLVGLARAAVEAPGALVAPACVDHATRRAVPNAFVGRQALTVTPGQAIEADGLSGYCVLMPRAVVDRIGLPDAARFPHYFGDNAYALAARRGGFHCRVLGQFTAEICHPQPALAGAAGRSRSFAAEFRSPKSPRRLGTLFAYQRLKYGVIAGSLLAGGRAAWWLASWGMHRLVRRSST